MKIVLDTSVIISACDNIETVVRGALRYMKKYGTVKDFEHVVAGKNTAAYLSRELILHNCINDTCIVSPSVDKEIRIEHPVIRECFVKLRHGLEIPDGKNIKVNVVKVDERTKSKVAYVLEKLGFNLCRLVSRKPCLSDEDVEVLSLAISEKGILVTNDGYMAKAGKALGLQVIYITEEVEKLEKKGEEVLEKIRNLIKAVITT